MADKKDRDVLSPIPLDSKTARLRAARLARDASLSKSEHPHEHHRVFGLEDEMPFGMFKGKPVEYVMDTRIGYISWLLENTAFELSPAAEREYQSRLDPRRPRGAWVGG